MREKFWNKKIPTLLGILLIAVSVGVTTFLVNQTTFFKSNASLSDQPKDVRITNVTDSSFTVSYSTDSQVPGSLNYGKDKSLGQTGLDDRDQQSGNLANYNIHNITLRSLQSETQYFFTITSGQNNYLSGGDPFTVTTAASLSAPLEQTPMTGKITLPDGTAPTEAIIYVTTDNAQVISTLTKSDGSFILPLNSLRTSDLSSYYALPDNAIIKILALGDSLTSNVVLSASQANLIPTIVLSDNYDFRTSQQPTGVPVNLESFPSFNSTPSANASPEILTPKDNQTFTDQQPLFKGTTLPSQNVKITIQSDDVIQANVTADTNGNWTYRPANPLVPGNHTISITAKNSSGVLETITRSFVIYASGQQINPAAPSGAPTPTAAPTLSPPVTQKITPTLTMTPTGTITPPIAQAQTKGGIISPTGTLPPTGNPSIITAGIVGTVVVIAGGLLFLLAL
jgi:hypothetical protein